MHQECHVPKPQKASEHAVHEKHLLSPQKSPYTCTAVSTPSNTVSSQCFTWTCMLTCPGWEGLMES